MTAGPGTRRAWAERFLESRREEKVVLGLARIRGTLERLGSPHLRYPCAIVAGTNGKGSVSALVAAALRESGRRTGLTTSPHLLCVRERIRVDGRAISPDELEDCLARVRAAETRPLTYFELVTAAAFLHFADRAVEAAVLEVGLGGRLDATNVVPEPAVSVVVTIGYDHMDWLGPTLASIAKEKAGILRKGRPALMGAMPEEARDAVVREARRVGARLEEAPELFRTVSVDWKKGSQTLEGPGGERWTLGLLGERQAANASLAFRTCELLGRSGLKVGREALERAFAGARWPGRFMPVQGGRFVLDGAHNAQAAEAFARTWAASPFSDSGSFILGMLKDKDADAVLAPLAPFLRRVQVCEPRSPRALPASRLAQAVRRTAPQARVERAPSLAAALKRAGPGPTAVLGSFYLVGEACRLLEAPV